MEAIKGPQNTKFETAIKHDKMLNEYQINKFVDFLEPLYVNDDSKQSTKALFNWASSSRYYLLWIFCSVLCLT